jgi:hypothetical protein
VPFLTDTSFILAAFRVCFKNTPDLVAHISKHRKLSLFGARGMGRVGETPMMTVYLAGKNRARLVCVSANCNDCLNFFVEELVEVLGLMAGYVDADFVHDFDRQWMDITSWFGTGAGDFDFPAHSRAKNPFGKMTPAGVARAKNKDKGLIH